MKRLFPFLLLLIVIASCNNNGTNKTDNKDTTQVPKNTASLYDKLLGSFVGTFGTNKITLLISKAVADTVLGRSIVGGNDRPFTGTALLKDGLYTIVAKEPGDDKNDGTFNFNIDATNMDIVKGSWAPYNDSVKGKKEYVLNRKSFEYKPNVGTYQASSKLLQTSDVENMMKTDLETMRNEIFARHGYCFKKKETRAIFENEDWYVPNTVDVRDKLTDIEKKNIALIKRYEKYADDYGDDFGR